MIERPCRDLCNDLRELGFVVQFMITAGKAHQAFFARELLKESLSGREVHNAILLTIEQQGGNRQTPGSLNSLLHRHLERFIVTPRDTLMHQRIMGIRVDVGGIVVEVRQVKV